MRMDKPFSPLKRLSSWKVAHRGFQASLDLSRDSGNIVRLGDCTAAYVSNGMAACANLLSGGPLRTGRTFLPLACKILSSGPLYGGAFFTGVAVGGADLAIFAAADTALKWVSVSWHLGHSKVRFRDLPPLGSTLLFSFARHIVG